MAVGREYFSNCFYVVVIHMRLCYYINTFQFSDFQMSWANRRNFKTVKKNKRGDNYANTIVFIDTKYDTTYNVGGSLLNVQMGKTDTKI